MPSPPSACIWPPPSRCLQFTPADPLCACNARPRWLIDWAQKWVLWDMCMLACASARCVVSSTGLKASMRLLVGHTCPTQVGFGDAGSVPEGRPAVARQRRLPGRAARAAAPGRQCDARARAHAAGEPDLPPGELHLALHIKRKQIKIPTHLRPDQCLHSRPYLCHAASVVSKRCF